MNFNLTFSNPQLPYPWHANQNRALVTYVYFVCFFITVVPISHIHASSENVNQPSPESQGIINLEFFIRNNDDIKSKGKREKTYCPLSKIYLRLKRTKTRGFIGQKRTWNIYN